jgi:MYXO-CTERM domain-containing protein
LKTCLLSLSLMAAAALTASTQAEFVDGFQLDIAGTAFGSDGNAATTWGGAYQLGTAASYVDNLYGPPFQINVSSDVISSTVVVFSFDFSQWAPQDFPMHALDLYDLKTDLSIFDVSASAGTVVTDGNDVHWQGSGADITGAPAGNGSYKLLITVTQVPAPGALALLGFAGVVCKRRRRA